MKIVIDDKIPFIRGAFEPFAEVAYIPGGAVSSSDVRDADAVVTRTRTICNESLLAGSSVKVIASATIGYDHIDTAWCESNGIEWTNAPGCNSGSVCQYISSVLVCLARKYNLDLEGLTLGVVGVGNVGSKVAAAARALGMTVLLNDPPRARREGPEAFVSLDELQSRADIITLHVPLIREGQDATGHLFDAERISRLRSDQILINSSRGPVVDNQALKSALKAGSVRDAVLDVWEGEPNIDLELLGLLDLATPHIAGYSADGKAGGTAASVRAVARRLGLPLDGWLPTSVPAPSNPLEFSIDATGRTPFQVVSEAISYTYDVRRDSAALKGAPADFERLRGDYPIRREPHAFSLFLCGADTRTCEALEALGFCLR